MPSAEQLLGLSTLTTVTNLVPRDVYSAKVLEAVYAERKFAGIVSAAREDLNAGPGNVVKVPFIDVQTAQGPIAEGTALTPNDTVTGVYPIALAKYGAYDLVNREVFEDQTVFSQDDFLANLGRALAEKVDFVAYNALATASGVPASNIKTLAAAGVLSDLYNKVVDVKAGLISQKRSPSHLLISQDQEAQFLKDTNFGIVFANIVVQDGQLLVVAGLQVVRSPLANGNTATLSAIQAIVIDARRALGEAWGRRPETVVDENSRVEFDQVKLVTWLRYGAAALDPKAIGYVKNPAS